MKHVYIVEGKSGDTYKVASSNTATAIAAAKLYTGTNKSKAQLLEIDVEDNPIRVAYGSTPISDGATKLGHVYDVGSKILVRGYHRIASLKYINKESGMNAALMITVVYE